MTGPARNSGTADDEARWAEALRSLSIRDRTRVASRLRGGRSPLEPQHVGPARLAAEELLPRRGGVVVQTGLTVAFTGLWIGDRSLFRT